MKKHREIPFFKMPHFKRKMNGQEIYISHLYIWSIWLWFDNILLLVWLRFILFWNINGWECFSIENHLNILLQKYISILWLNIKWCGHIIMITLRYLRRNFTFTSWLITRRCFISYLHLWMTSNKTCIWESNLGMSLFTMTRVF